ncbi:MAG TPA: anthranilate synthase component I [Candidatus Latescibacteria bacterium]|nr:anthranilate synthase component I [Candidatus Latescibacterota bacterium]HOF62073.1 anthranilate synthase component I [Candidatus Latescibacterota bacterium]HOS64519.1 anthranilate synthase component I [Candidatus Latescibacterota bacterium]HPK74006.1 anthranilate synthase component I [Candidatus Latescibacterota bacterium]
MSESEIAPSFEEAKRLVNAGAMLPVHRRILADTETPVSAYMKIRAEDRYSFLLESVEGAEKYARYSFLGVDPFLKFSASGTRSEAHDRRSNTNDVRDGNPISHLRELLHQHRGIPLEGLPRFSGGAVGYFAYDAVRWVEKISDSGTDDIGLDDAVFLFYDTVLVFDSVAHQIILVSNVRLTDDESELRVQYDAAVRKIAHLEKLLAYPVNPRPVRGTGISELSANMTREQFERAVEVAKEFIRAGDIIQVVLAQRFRVKIASGAFDIYRRLRIVNPSPYMFFLALDDTEILGASPELLCRVEAGVVHVRPIAGTRRRGATEDEDRHLEDELRADPKERSEHIMLVDLGRNDVGKVAIPGTVRVSEFMVVERYSHVMHLVSHINGRLREDQDRLDAFFSCFPAGTLSGAPKVRAMEIIDDLEPTRRGVYGGAIGYFDFAGNLDTCIAIRTVLVKNGVAFIQAGAGIVADSDASSEYEETLNKSRAMISAIEMAEMR